MKTRIVWTKIWEDDWFFSISQEARLVFLYLISNSRINMCGCYQLSDRVILSDTKIKNLPKVKKELFPKAKFLEGWVYLPNSQGYNGFTGVSNEVRLSQELKEIPENIKDTLFNDKSYTPLTPSQQYPDTPINNKSEIINQKYNIYNKYNKYNKIEDITEEDIIEISEKYKFPIAFVRSELDNMINWHEMKPQKNKYANYFRALSAWVKRDGLKIQTDYGKQTSDIAF